MSRYLHEIRIGQRYLTTREDGSQDEFELVNIHIANVDSRSQYTTVLSFKNDVEFFETNINQVVGSPVYELILNQNKNDIME